MADLRRKDASAPLFKFETGCNHNWAIALQIGVVTIRTEQSNSDFWGGVVTQFVYIECGLMPQFSWFTPMVLGPEYVPPYNIPRPLVWLD